MLDYQDKINEKLDRYMPYCVVALTEAKKDIGTKDYVTKAPTVKGYFKLISIRYMKRVSDIKKMCIEYINTYIDGALNVAKNMDDVKLCKGIDSLSTDLDFEVSDISTNNETKTSDNKGGVLFLTMDKALKTKLDTIIEKIKERSKRSEMLQEWATLMVLQSKIIANDIIIEETTKMLKDETTQKEQEKKNEKTKEEEKQKFDELNKKHQKVQKDLSEFIEQYGESSQWFKNKTLKISDLIDLTSGISSDDFSKTVVKDDALDDESKINKLRLQFYDEYGFADKVSEIITNAEGFNDLDAKIQNYIFACLAVENMEPDGKFTASPIDLCIVERNNKEVDSIVKKQGRDKLIDGIDTTTCDIEFDDPSKAEEAFAKYIKDKSFAYRTAYYFTRIFSEDKSFLVENSKLHILKSSQYIYEQMFDNTMNLADASLAMMDVLDDCEDGCLYVGNIPGFDEIDYIMLDGDGGWGMYAEHGDLQRALSGEGPQNVYPVEVTDSHKLALLTTLFDKLTADLASKLR